jgi:hypothetical protein
VNLPGVAVGPLFKEKFAMHWRNYGTYVAALWKSLRQKNFFKLEKSVYKDFFSTSDLKRSLVLLLLQFLHHCSPSLSLQKQRE